jgi:serine protease
MPFDRSNLLRPRRTRRLVIGAMAAMVTVVGVSMTTTASAGTTPIAFTAKVDAAAARPGHDPLPGFETGTVRAVASVADGEGGQFDFVENELVVMTADPTALKDLLVRRGGKVRQVLTEAIPAPMVGYLLQVDPTRADPSTLTADLATLNAAQPTGAALSFSSPTGLALMAMSAAEAVANGNTMTVGLNWLTTRTGFDDGTVDEASVGPSGPVAGNPYNFNAYTWSYLRSGSAQDIGVTSAWTLMDALDLLQKNKLRIGIVDSGFKPSVNNDLPPALLGSVHIFDGPEDPNPSPGGPWHGTQVASAAAAIPDNNRGAAGPAGPIADLSLVNSPVELFGLMSGLNHTVATGSRIVNISAGNRIPWWASFIVLPFDADTKLIRSVDDVLIFASAGNDGENVDATSCVLFVCFEKAWATPCENSGVICVGALATDSLNKASYSNYGNEDVDVYGPGDVLVGPTPAQPAQDANHQVSGTSVASPFVAGVAALIWATRLDLSADSVERVMTRTFHTSPDSKIKKRVINAYDAVRDVLPATVAILSPDEGDTLSVVSYTEVHASVYDDGHGPNTVVWAIDGVNFGTGLTSFVLATPGPHTITATVEFPDGVIATDSVTVNAVNHPPTVSITAPRRPDGTPPVFGQHQPIPFHAVSSDDAGALPDAQVTWHLDGSPTPFALGHNPTVSLGAGLGQHTITVQGCDTFGVCASESVPVLLIEDSANLPPTAQITSPANGDDIPTNGSDDNGFFAEITVASAVSDPEGGPVSLAWLVDGVQVATGPSPTVRLSSECEVVGHTITLIATDDAGNSTQDSIDVDVVILC